MDKVDIHFFKFGERERDIDKIPFIKKTKIFEFAFYTNWLIIIFKITKKMNVNLRPQNATPKNPAQKGQPKKTSCGTTFYNFVKKVVLVHLFFNSFFKKMI